MPASIRVETGPMFSAKSWRLIDHVMQAEHRDEKVVAVRPMTDRHPEPFIIARRIVGGVPQPAEQYPARIVATRKEFRLIWSDPTISLLAIDEGQFFSSWILPELQKALDMRRREKFRIIVAGLNMDYQKQPFGPMPRIMAMAAVVKVHAGVCMKCKHRKGLYTQRLHGGTEQKQPGDFGDYEVRCGICHFVFTGD